MVGDFCASSRTNREIYPGVSLPNLCKQTLALFSVLAFFTYSLFEANIRQPLKAASVSGQSPHE